MVFLFLQGSPLTRVLAVLAAACTDFFDGRLARKNKEESKLGAILDPLTDKFFVGCVLATLYMEEKILLWQALTMLVRDFSVFLFGIWLALTGQLASWRFRSILSGKIMTTLQLFVLILLAADVAVPSPFYFAFILIGSCAFFELYRSCRSIIPPEMQYPVKKIKEAQRQKKISKGDSSL